MVDETAGDLLAERGVVDGVQDERMPADVDGLAGSEGLAGLLAGVKSKGAVADLPDTSR
ncbi:hypothetical protein [Streptomyces rochei]|uniref:hypothetical protein n=1 Tax=Streptomyces rochei TaxID=1928 RepID=UPI0019449CB1|nr:hypothetical protein [Streptomyces rochei]